MNTFSRPSKQPAAAVGIGTGSGAGTGEAGSACPASPEFVPVRAMEEVMRVRAEQIFKHGHTAEADLAQPLYFFARDIWTRGVALMETCQFHQGKQLLRRRAVKLAAICLALIDRIDNEGENDAQ